MHFALKEVVLTGTPSCGVRGSLQGADVCEYAEAVKASWDTSFVQLSAGHLNAGIEFLVGDRFVLYRENWSQRLHTVGALLPGMLAFGIPVGTGMAARWWGRPLAAGMLPFGRSSSELDLVTEANVAIMVLAMAEEDFRRIFNRLTGLDSIHFLEGMHFFTVRPAAVPGLHTCGHWDNDRD